MGLVPFNPNLVMDKIPRPELDKEDHGSPKKELINRSDFICPQHQIKTPTTSNEVLTLRKQIEDDLIGNGLLNTPCKLRIHKLANGAENAFADWAILRRLATVRSGPDRGLFWRPFKKTGSYGPAPLDCSSVSKILDRTVRSGLFIT